MWQYENKIYWKSTEQLLNDRFLFLSLNINYLSLSVYLPCTDFVYQQNFLRTTSERQIFIFIIKFKLPLLKRLSSLYRFCLSTIFPTAFESEGTTSLAIGVVEGILPTPEFNEDILLDITFSLGWTGKIRFLLETGRRDLFPRTIPREDFTILITKTDDNIVCWCWMRQR